MGYLAGRFRRREYGRARCTRTRGWGYDEVTEW